MINWGILGAGRIAHRFAASLSHEGRSALVAISCRSEEKAAAFASEFGVASDHAFWDADGEGSAHEALLEDASVDAVYVALPHGLHAEWVERALLAGKAVLCEKPLALNEDEARRLTGISRREGVLLMEGMKTRFTPAYRRVRELVLAGGLGEVERVEATLCNDMLAQFEAGTTYISHPGEGGVLLDCGTYCASWLDDFAPGECSLKTTSGVLRDGIDLYANAELAMGEKSARLECAFDRKKPRTATIVGSRGRMVVDELHRPQHATVYLAGATPREINAPYEVDDFYGEIRHFVDLVEGERTESDVMPLSSSIRDAAILDLVRTGIQRETGRGAGSAGVSPTDGGPVSS